MFFLRSGGSISVDRAGMMLFDLGVAGLIWVKKIARCKIQGLGNGHGNDRQFRSYSFAKASSTFSM